MENGKIREQEAALNRQQNYWQSFSRRTHGDLDRKKWERE